VRVVALRPGSCEVEGIDGSDVDRAAGHHTSPPGDQR
jgi:hypothetical protein